MLGWNIGVLCVGSSKEEGAKNKLCSAAEKRKEKSSGFLVLPWISTLCGRWSSASRSREEPSSQLNRDRRNIFMSGMPRIITSFWMSNKNVRIILCCRLWLIVCVILRKVIALQMEPTKTLNRFFTYYRRQALSQDPARM